jgi:hypothetical protein
METNKPKLFNEPKQSVERLEDVMKDLEQKVNPKSPEESLDQMTKAMETGDPSILLLPMQAGAKEFEARMGRPMTYGEMRAMWG